MVKISALTELTVPDGANDVIAIVDDSAVETKKIKIPNILGVTHTQEIDLADNFMDIKRITIPANPATDYGRIYIKQVDASNDGIFIIVKKAGVMTEVQIA